MRKPSYYLTIGALAALVGALAVTNQSLWIDEGSAALKAMQPSLGGWWHDLRSEGNSNLQLIGELFYLWVWAKIFGASEIALRASNIPFFVLGVVGLAWGISRRRRLQNAIAVLALTNAFLWYYLNEARPYIVLFAFAALTTGCLLRLLEEPESATHSRPWCVLFSTGLVGLCATSLLAVPWALGALGAVLYWGGFRATLRSARRFRVASGITAAALGALGVYYLWTLQLGARASDVGRTSWPNVAFIFYELLGLSGVGPGRLELREKGVSALFPFAPWIALGAVATLVLLCTGLWMGRARLTKRHFFFCLIAVAAPFALALAAALAGHMRLLGRHLTPLLPWLLAAMASGLAALFSGPLWKRTLAKGIVLLLFLSALEIRLALRHERDDYRTAAGLARAEVAAGGRVWWLADLRTARYYGVPVDSPAVLTSPRTPAPDDKPSLVLLSKPDIYDGSGAARAYLAAENFRVAQVRPAFQIWRRPPGR